LCPGWGRSQPRPIPHPTRWQQMGRGPTRRGTPTQHPVEGPCGVLGGTSEGLPGPWGAEGGLTSCAPPAPRLGRPAELSSGECAGIPGRHARARRGEGGCRRPAPERLCCPLLSSGGSREGNPP